MKLPHIYYLSPTEVIKKYPELKHKHNWNVSLVSYLLQCNLLKGYYDRAKKTPLVEENSVLQLIGYLNNSIEEQKVII